MVATLLLASQARCVCGPFADRHILNPYWIGSGLPRGPDGSETPAQTALRAACLPRTAPHARRTTHTHTRARAHIRMHTHTKGRLADAASPPGNCDGVLTSLELRRPRLLLMVMVLYSSIFNCKKPHHAPF